MSARFDIGWSSAHPAVADLRSREQAVREAILSRGHKISAAHLLDFVREIVMATQTFIDNGDFELAEVTALRAELLLRNPSNSRRRYNDEDWLNLGTSSSTIPSATQGKVEQERVALLAQTLQHIAFIYKMLGRFESAKLALMDAVEMQGGDMRPQTMLNLLSIISHLPEEESTTLHIASEAVYALARELEALLEPSLSSVLVNGTIAQRNAYTGQRHLAATLLVTAQLYLADGARFRFVRSAESRNSNPHGRIYCLHRITLAYAELQRLAMQELSEDHVLHDQLAESVADWSLWLAESIYGNSDERRMSNEKSERWKFQVRRSRQFASMNCVFVDGDYPALEFLYERYPHSSGFALLLLAAGSDSSLQVAEAQDVFVSGRSTIDVQQDRDAVERTSKRRKTPDRDVVHPAHVSEPRGSLERQLAEVPSPSSLPPVIMQQTERSAYLHLSSFVAGTVAVPHVRRRGDAVFVPVDSSPVPPPKPVASISSRAPSTSDETAAADRETKTAPTPDLLRPLEPHMLTAERELRKEERESSPEISVALAAVAGDGRVTSHGLRKLLGPTSRPATNDMGVPEKQAPLPKRRAPSDSAIR